MSLPDAGSKRRSLRSSALRFLFAAGMLYLAFSLVFGAGFVVKQAMRRPHPVSSKPLDLSPQAEDISFVSDDAYTLRGYLSPPAPGAPVLFFQHGRGRTRDSYLVWSRPFAQAGYGIVAFDWRGHGNSDGKIIQHSAQEPRDLHAALDFLQTREATRDRPIGLFGASMGASSLAMAGGQLPERVRCMVLDSPFGDLGRMANGRLSSLGPLALGPRLVLDGIGMVLFGKPIQDIAPERELQGFSPRPILVIHGEHDKTIPHSEGLSLFTAYPGPKEFWSTPEPGHCEARSDHTREWIGRLARFFQKNLPGAPEAERVLANTPEKLKLPKGWW